MSFLRKFTCIYTMGLIGTILVVNSQQRNMMKAYKGINSSKEDFVNPMFIIFWPATLYHYIKQRRDEQ